MSIYVTSELSNSEYTDITTLSGIDVGEDYSVVNYGSCKLKVIQAEDQPALDDPAVILTTMEQPYADLTIDANTDVVWVLSMGYGEAGTVGVFS